MGRFLFKRFYLTILVMLAVSIIAFGLIRLIPGDPAYVILGVNATDELVAEARVALGLDKPIAVQYLIYLRNMLQGDLGMSTTYNQACATVLLPRIAGTMSLAFAAFLLAFVFSIPLGIIAGIKKGAFADLFATLFALLGNARMDRKRSDIGLCGSAQMAAHPRVWHAKEHYPPGNNPGPGHERKHRAAAALRYV